MCWYKYIVKFSGDTIGESSSLKRAQKISDAKLKEINDHPLYKEDDYMLLQIHKHARFFWMVSRDYMIIYACKRAGSFYYSETSVLWPRPSDLGTHYLSNTEVPASMRADFLKMEESIKNTVLDYYWQDLNEGKWGGYQETK